MIADDHRWSAQTWQQPVRMRIAAFSQAGFQRLGLVRDDQIIDLARALPALPTDLRAFLRAGSAAIDAASTLGACRHAALPIADVRLEAPIRDPQKFLGIGANYPGKVAPGTDAAAPKDEQDRSPQIWFNKQVSCITGPFDPIIRPLVSHQLVFECELAFIVGRRCRHISKADAHHFIAGYLICNDVTVVDWLLASPTATLGKSFDTHGPIGPWLVSSDELGDPHDLELRTFVNGAPRQSGSTADMKYDCFDMIEHLSKVFTLEPGDVITTGTPSLLSRDYLVPGDLVRCEIDRIGAIENVVSDEVGGPKSGTND